MDAYSSQVPEFTTAVSIAEQLSDVQEAEDMELELGTFPLLVRSMSTSRRHSWEVPLSPIEPGRRLSLDTSTMDTDGDRDEDLQHPAQLYQYSVYPEYFSDLEEPNGPIDKDLTSCKVKETESESEKGLYSKFEVITSEQCRDQSVSHTLETLTGAASVAGEEWDLDKKLHAKDAQSHMVKKTGVGMEDRETSGNVTWYEFLSNEKSEGEEDHMEKTEFGNKKVKRTFSSFKNRVTGSFNKDKGKSKEKGSKENAKAHSNGHQFVPGTFSSCTTCSLCSKTLQKKNSLQCQNCAVNVHRNCRNLLAECSSSSKFKDFPKKITGTVQQKVQYYNQALKDSSSADGPAGTLCRPGMTVALRGLSNQTSTSGTSTSLSQNTNSGSILGEMDDPDGIKLKSLTDDSVSLAPFNVELIILEDAQYTMVQADLQLDAQEFEAQSWSLAVEAQYLKKHPKLAVKRQDVIYELIQTEMHHVRTLKVMKWVYAHRLRETLQMDDRKLERLFPRLESLLEVHRLFLLQLKERRRQNLESGSERNYVFPRIGDILISQFSGEIGEKMEESYGDFCSHHTEAVNYYKEQMQNNKKFHNLIRKINNLSVVRRLGVPECILLVTQRITKYPVLVERILENTEGGTEEYRELGLALELIKDVIKKVNTRISDYEKAARLRDIAGRMEPKTQGRIKDGHVLSREDIVQGSRKLLYEGTVNWKAASGRLKDVLAVLLTDILLLLQEKDQKYTFSAVDSKPSVISLQKLIVREVAHEEKAMFLICASSNEPEMYEIHTASKEERNTWMAMIRQAVESYSHTEEGQKEERASRLKEFQEQLSLKDAQIIQSLTEKLQIFAHFAEVSAGMEDARSCTRLLLRGDSSDLQQGETFLRAAISEVECLQDLLLCAKKEAPPASEEDQGPGGPPRRADTFGGYDSSPTVINKSSSAKKHSDGEDKPRERSQRTRSDPQLKEMRGEEALEESADEGPPSNVHSVHQKCVFEAEFLDRVLMLSQRLYSLQAVISQQDSHIDLQRASLVERERGGRLRGSLLLEQEKQRSLEKQREELASFQRLQNQHRQELVRWERERERQEQEARANATQLLQREDECRKLEAQLAEEREELDHQREKYQQDLERLREATRAVEKEKEWLEQQKRLKKQKISPGLLRPDVAQDLPPSSSFNGDIGLIDTRDDLGLAAKPHVHYSLSPAPGDHPEVLPRRESSSSLSIKTDVPIHLVSTTNQLHKQAGVQQQIPTKLAALSKGKEKGSKSKSSHRTESSASLDMKQMLPLKLSGKEDSGSKAKRSDSPLQTPHPDPTSPADSHVDIQQMYRVTKHKHMGHNTLQDLSPPFCVPEDGTKEDVIFF